MTIKEGNKASYCGFKGYINVAETDILYWLSDNTDEFTKFIETTFANTLGLLHGRDEKGVPFIDGIVVSPEGLPLHDGWHGPLIFTDNSRCQCGSDKIGADAHSTWCPKHN